MPNARFPSRALVAIAGTLLALVVVLVLRSDRGASEPPAVALPTVVAETAPLPELASLGEPGRTVRVESVAPPEAAADTQPRTPIDAKPGKLRPPGWQQVFAPSIPTPEGVLEVIVLADESPVAGVPIAIWPTRAARLEDFPGLERRLWTGVDGIARFETLDEGDYWVRAWPETAWTVDGSGQLRAGQANRRVILRVGTGIVHGVVYDSSGAPWPDAEVYASCQVQGGLAYARYARADAQGRYRFERLAPGFVILSQNVADPAQARWRTNRARFVLERGETLEVDLGSAQPFAVWTGSVRVRSGEALELPAQLEFDELDHGFQHVTMADASGRFRIELPRGDWVVRSSAHLPNVELGRFSVSADRIEQDVTVPCTVVRLRVHPEPKWVARFFLDAPPNQVSLVELGGVRIAVVTRPDVYRLRMQSPVGDAIAGEPPGGFEVDLRQSQPLVDLDFALALR